MRLDRHDDAVQAALAAARSRDLYLIVRLQERHDRRLVVVDGGVERQRSTRLAGVGVHVVTPDGSIGFASADDVTPKAAREAVLRAGDLAEAARALDAQRSLAPFALQSMGRVRLERPAQMRVGRSVAEQARTLVEAQDALAFFRTADETTIRTSLQVVDEEWRIVRSDGTDIEFSTPRASLRHDVSARIDGKIARAAGVVSGDSIDAIVTATAHARLTRRAVRAASDARLAATAPAARTGSYRVVLRHALAKGLAHEAIGHLCESDVDGSVLMRRGKLRIGEQLGRETISVVDGPVLGDYAQQAISANGLRREDVVLVDRGVLQAGLGDLFSAGQAGVPITGACRVGTFRERPTPRMTNIRIEVAKAAPLDADPDDLSPDDVVAVLLRAGLVDRGQPTIYLTGYRGGQAHPRRGDFVFGTDAAFDVSAGGSPLGPVSFSGLAERALAAIVAGIGPLCTDAIGTCSKDGSGVSSSGGSHALLVLDPDPDLIVSAAT